MNEITKIGIIGAGVIGRSIAVDLVFHKKSTVIVDHSEAVLIDAQNEILNNIRFAPLIHKNVPKMSEEEALSYITFTNELNDVKECGYIIENITEDINLKKELYSRLDKICKTDAFFAANTSCIPITLIAGFTERRSQVIGMHFMNPVFLTKAVEVIKGIHTSTECIDISTKMLYNLDKEAIIVNDFPGFVSNRISHLFMNEAAFVVQDRIASPNQVDKIFKECFGHKMGPLETADLIGIDTVVNSLDVLYKSYQDSKYRCCPLLKQMVDSGNIGRKSGKGFYNYSR
jgi:3-hydroxybutyryl-CoA dehydrogenase